MKALQIIWHSNERCNYILVEDVYGLLRVTLWSSSLPFVLQIILFLGALMNSFNAYFLSTCDMTGTTVDTEDKQCTAARPSLTGCL